MTNTTFDPYHTTQSDNNGVVSEEVYEIETGRRRVIRLLLITLFFVGLACLIIFVLIPYVDAINQPTAPPLPPAIHT